MTRTTHRIYAGSLIIIGLFVVVAIGVYGFDYYNTPVALRHEHALDDQLSPTGFWGHGMGFIGAFLMTFGVLLYSVRKRWGRLSQMGAIKHVLEFHIFLCLVGPALIVYHTAFKFGGIISVSFWCMVTVVASGVIGRYLYMQIPKTITGREITRPEMEKRIAEIGRRLVADFNVPEWMAEIDRHVPDVAASRHKSMVITLPRLVLQHYQLNRAVKTMMHKLVGKYQGDGVLIPIRTLFLEKVQIQRQMAGLEVTQRMFRHWHMFHLPFAIVMFVIMVVHIVVAFLFGYGWIFTN